MEPISTTITGACQATGLSRSRLYELIAANRITTFKMGRRRLVRIDSLRNLIRDAE